MLWRLEADKPMAKSSTRGGFNNLKYSKIKMTLQIVQFKTVLSDELLLHKSCMHETIGCSAGYNGSVCSLLENGKKWSGEKKPQKTNKILMKNWRSCRTQVRLLGLT